ncbi:MAG: chemotaxis protein CheX [Deltaproteobacteria bacterium]|nr:chemotaxis protein CheX [Deltaproteobacteria bacterium]MBW2648519.1 chemotaxis protein CheX [Deltaproteobacteria bacterium]
MKKIEEMMRLSISEVFEKMFFVFLEPLDDECNEYDMEAAIRFEGSINGEVRVLLSRDIAKTMIQNMLGLKEDEITAQRMEDCSKEAVNMICGNFLGKLDSTKVFKLSIPTFAGGGFIRPVPLGSMNQTPASAGMESTGIEPGENACRMDFDSDGGKVGVIIEID